MIYFMDFEASSLDANSYPIEVALVDLDKNAYSALIRPEPKWTDWNPESEKIHGISREELMDRGLPAAQVAKDLVERLMVPRTTVHTDAPPWDQGWLNTLLFATGRTEKIRVLENERAFFEAFEPILKFETSKAQMTAIRLYHQVRNMGEGRPRIRHRALPDAEHMCWMWHEMHRLAKNEAALMAKKTS